MVMPDPSERILAPRADEAAILLAFEACAVEEPLAHGRMMAVADRRDHVPAVVAKVLDRLLPRDVPLVRHEDGKDEDEASDDQANHPALEASVGLERQRAPQSGHGPASRLLVQILMGSDYRVLEETRTTNAVLYSRGSYVAAVRVC
jgi:hypothetical protein